jgi:hypothetical protein
MKTVIQLFTDIVTQVKEIYEHLQLQKYEQRTGRPLALSIIEIVALSLFWKTANIFTKKMVYEIFRPSCSYKTMVVNMNRHALLAAIILKMIWVMNRSVAHLVKKTDTTDIPVCLNKNAKNHKTMKGLAEWGHSGKGFFYGLKLGLSTDLLDRMLGILLAPGNTDDREMFREINKKLYGIFVADAGHISEKLERDFLIEKEGIIKRILFAKPKKNMKKIVTAFQKFLYDTRQRIELDFRNLKMFFGLVTSLPRSVTGYFANYIYSILAYVMCA